MDQGERKIICPWCESDSLSSYHEDRDRHYIQCKHCELVFVPREELISDSEEKNRYEQHINSISDIHYKNYFLKIIEKLGIVQGERVLDFGCGKEEMLKHLLPQNEVESFDIFFHRNDEIWTKKFHKIVLIEVFEHSREPKLEITKLRSLLAPEGKIIIMTQAYPDKNKFNDWFYKRDKTHIQFVSAKTFSTESDLIWIQ